MGAVQTMLPTLCVSSRRSVMMRMQIGVETCGYLEFHFSSPIQLVIALQTWFRCNSIGKFDSSNMLVLDPRHFDARNRIPTEEWLVQLSKAMSDCRHADKRRAMYRVFFSIV